MKPQTASATHAVHNPRPGTHVGLMGRRVTLVRVRGQTGSAGARGPRPSTRSPSHPTGGKNNPLPSLHGRTSHVVKLLGTGPNPARAERQTTHAGVGTHSPGGTARPRLPRAGTRDSRLPPACPLPSTLRSHHPPGGRWNHGHKYSGPGPSRSQELSVQRLLSLSRPHSPMSPVPCLLEVYLVGGWGRALL